MLNSPSWINPSLEHMQEACEAAGHPERSFAVIQVAGTNGKTSTARLIDDLLRGEGLSSALYTSPELLDNTERIRANGVNIRPDDLDTALVQARAVATSIGITLTEFEETTLACFLHLRDARVDFAVLEVGLGGKWDATSAATPAVAVITGIALDHTDILGDTTTAIARDKAAIIKPGSSVVLGESVGDTAPIFLERAAELGLHPRRVTADSYHIDRDTLSTRPTSTPSTPRPTDATSTPFTTHFSVTTAHATYPDLTLAAPAYQASNAATALVAAEAALGRPLDPQRVRSALSTTTFPGRFECLRTDPLLIFDGGHNPQAAALLADLIVQLTSARPVLLPTKPTIALGVLADKDVDGIIAALAPVASSFIALEPPSPRALPATTLAQKLPHCRAVLTGMDALLHLLNVTKNEPLIIAGSLSLYRLLQSLEGAAA